MRRRVDMRQVLRQALPAWVVLLCLLGTPLSPLLASIGMRSASGMACCRGNARGCCCRKGTLEKNGSRNWAGTPACGNRCTTVLAMPQGATAVVFAATHGQAPAATRQILFASRGFPASSPYRAELLERPPPAGLR